MKNRACRSSGTPCLYVIFYLFSGIRQIRLFRPRPDPSVQASHVSAEFYAHLLRHRPNPPLQVLIRGFRYYSGIIPVPVLFRYCPESVAEGDSDELGVLDDLSVGIDSFQLACHFCERDFCDLAIDQSDHVAELLLQDQLACSRADLR